MQEGGDPFTQVAERMSALVEAERQHAQDMQRWWDIFINQWENDLRAICQEANLKLRQFNFYLSGVQNNHKSGAQTKITIMSHFGNPYGDRAIPCTPLTFSLQHDGDVSIVSAIPDTAIAELLAINISRPLAKIALTMIVSQYAECLIARHVGPASRS